MTTQTQPGARSAPPKPAVQEPDVKPPQEAATPRHGDAADRGLADDRRRSGGADVERESPPSTGSQRT
jgi:hypothetical protein